MSKGRLFKSMDDVLKELGTSYTIKGDKVYVPSLQSDYTLVIYDEYKSNVNPNNYETILVQSLDLSPLKNGFTMNMDKLGMQSADFNANYTLTFTYVGTPYQTMDADYDGTYTSIIHYYYNKRFTKNGLLKIKKKEDKLPAIFILNLRTNHIVYVLKDCVFSYPTYQASPNSNAIALYSTSVTYSSYKEILFDNLNTLTRENKGTIDLNLV